MEKLEKNRKNELNKGEGKEEEEAAAALGCRDELVITSQQLYFKFFIKF